MSRRPWRPCVELPGVPLDDSLEPPLGGSDGAPLTGGGVWSLWVAAVFARAFEATHERAVGEDGDAYVAPGGYVAA